MEEASDEEIVFLTKRVVLSQALLFLVRIYNEKGFFYMGAPAFPAKLRIGIMFRVADHWSWA